MPFKLWILDFGYGRNNIVFGCKSHKYKLIKSILKNSANI